MNTEQNPGWQATPNGWHRRQWLAVTTLVALLPLAAEAAGPLNLNAQGVALHGHDPVAYFMDGKPIKGTAELSASSNGAVYWFANAANRQAFQANPSRYEPQYGGYCAYGVAQGAKPDIDPNAFVIVDGKLYLNLSPGVQKRWQADVPGYITQANKNWMSLKDQ